MMRNSKTSSTELFSSSEFPSASRVIKYTYTKFLDSSTTFFSVTMVVFYDDVVGEGGQEYSVRERPHDEQSRQYFVGGQYTSEEDAMRMLQGSVSPSQVEINPRSPTWQPSASKFTLPPGFVQSQGANASSRHASARSRDNTPQSDILQERPSGSSSRRKKGKKNEDASLDDLWYESGTSWDKVKPKKEKPRKTGMRACTTGPECFSCGAKLSLNQVTNSGVRCPVCQCFN
ncbi:hypothetical protein F5B19DRAFT_431037 [Rostrohypoxylon terebratum]|nr:hypothetical protein F5B19DRAFT_431037 [Rostrohypoxylon terebratum]